ncbi:MAG: GNAT family N-acetyltransferase, partial [Cytophagales bacterium]
VWLGIAVAENVKGRGFGKQLLKCLLDHAEKRMIATLKLSVDKINKQAIALYTKFGFKTVGEANERSILMELKVVN